MDAQVRYRCAYVWRWRGRSADVSVSRCKSTQVRERTCRKTERKTDRQKEREGGCEGVTVWMYRCDIDVQMCGCVEVERYIRRCERVAM